MVYEEFALLIAQRTLAAFTTFRDGCMAAPTSISIANTEGPIEDPNWPNDLSFIVRVFNGNGGARRTVFARIVLADAQNLGFPDMFGHAGVILTVHNWRGTATRPPANADVVITGYLQGNFPQDLVSYDTESGIAVLESKLTEAESAVSLGVTTARIYLRT